MTSSGPRTDTSAAPVRAPSGLAELIRVGVQRTAPAGTVLMRQGEAADNLYVVTQGTLLVEREHPSLTSPVPLAELGPGEVVGEMALLDGSPRSATVTVLEDAVLLEVSATQVQEILARHPATAQYLLHVLSRRLGQTDDLVVDVAIGQRRI